MHSILNYIQDNEVKGLLFDLNGTMIDDIEYHIQTWHKIINDMGRPITYQETKVECYGRNEELIERIFPGRFSLEERLALGAEKEAKYREEFLPQLKLIDGLEDFLKHTKSIGIQLAIGSAAVGPNIDYVLDNCNIRSYFDTIVGSEDVSNSKPDPEVFIKCADQLGLAAHQCIVFEDVPKGVEAARNAGMKSYVIKTTHDEGDFVYLDGHVIGYLYDYK